MNKCLNFFDNRFLIRRRTISVQLKIPYVFSPHLPFIFYCDHLTKYAPREDGFQDFSSFKNSFPDPDDN